MAWVWPHILVPLSHWVKKIQYLEKSGPPPQVKMSRVQNKKSRFTLHLAQFPSYFGQALKTLKKLEKLLRDHPIAPGDWLIMPEMWCGLYDEQNPKKERLGNASCYHWLKNWTRAHRCYAVGSMLEMPRSQAYNTAFVLGPGGKLLGRYRKMNLFPLSGEDRQFRPGRSRTVLKVPPGPLGLAICYDLRFPEHFRALAKRGAQWVLVPSAWPKERLDHFRSLLRARAIENQCFVIAVNKCGPEKGGMVFAGHSMVLDPWGHSIQELGSGAGIVRVDIDLKETQRIRKQYPFLPF